MPRRKFPMWRKRQKNYVHKADRYMPTSERRSPVSEVYLVDPSEPTAAEVVAGLDTLYRLSPEIMPTYEDDDEA